MGYATAADGALDRAKSSIRDAIRNLSQICVEQCDGHNDLSDEYRTKIDQIFMDLIQIRKELG